MEENHHGAQFHMWGQHSNACNLCIVVKEILSGIYLKSLGPAMDIFWAIDRKTKGYVLKSRIFFVKNCEDMKKWLYIKITKNY